ncbi:MAG: tetratricopeptide repeat protein [Kangiellaceae bacterium]|jgi:tetratricopeptide (TPR) repeat protein|nr:tetratricopeptide repeat protein [Kangiellaceae bacterium]
MMFLRKLTVILSTLALLSCANLSLNPFSDERVPITNVEPTVEFLAQSPVTVPESSIEDVNLNQVIESYLRLMQSPHNEVKRQAMRRLADLTMRLAEERAAELADGKSLDQIPPAIREASFAKASELYQRVITEFPQQVDDATIRYQLSRALALEGNSDESLLQLDQLVANHTESNEMVEVQFRRGESYFLRSNYNEAINAYQKVIDFGDETQFYDKALYKLGWSLFKAFEYELALEQFFPLYERLIEQSAASSVEQVRSELVNDTYRAISLSFYNLDGATSIKAFFAKFGTRPYEFEIYQRLSQLYLSQQRFQDAANTYLAFVETNPMHEQAALFQLAVIQTYIDGGFPSLVLPAKESFLTQFGVKSDYWQQSTDGHKAKLTPSVLTNLDEVSSHYHSLAQSTREPQDFVIAAQWYSHFLDLLAADDQRKPNYHFLMAEALLDAKSYRRAITEFDIVGYNYPTYSKRELAAYNVLVSYQALLDGNQKQLSSSKGQARTKLTAERATLQQNIIDNSLKFADQYPSSARSATLVLNAAEQQLAFKQIDKAITTSRKLLGLTGSKTKQQTDRAIIIIANGLFDLKKYAEAEQTITQVLGQANLDAKQRAEFRQRRAQSIYQQAEAFKAANDFDNAIIEYRRMVATEPGSSIRPNAEIEAAVLLMKLEQWSDAKIALEKFRQNFAKHPLANGLDNRLALVYEKLEDWEAAADTYQRIAEVTTDGNDKRDIYWLIADLYEKAERTTKAIAAYKSYVWTYPVPYLQAMEGRAKLVGLYEVVNDPLKRDFWRKQIITQHQKMTAENNARTNYLAARASFKLAEPLFSKFNNIKLTLPLTKSLPLKRKAMDDALKTYSQIAKYKVAEYTTASTHRVGMLYATLAKDIISSEKPKGLSEEELEEYGYLIEDQAFPIEEKAIEIYITNTNRVVNKLYDDWIKRSFDELARLQPARYNKQEVIEPWFGG